MKYLAIFAVLGCHGSDPPAATQGSAQALAVTFQSCTPATPIPSAEIVTTDPGNTVGSGSAAVARAAIATTAWFPYALGEPAPDDIAAPVAMRASTAIGEHLAEIDRCVTGKRGSIVAMLAIAPAATANVSARVGGLGDPTSEACIAKVLRALAVAGADRPVELACRMFVKDAGPLRVESAGYRNATVTKDGVQIDSVAQKLPGDRVDDATPYRDTVYRVLFDPDVPKTRLDGVLSSLADAAAVLVAVKAESGTPVFVAMGPDRRPARAGATRMQIGLDGTKLRACVGDRREPSASILEPRAVDKALRGSAATCGAACDRTVEIGGSSYVAKDLVAGASAVRRAGFEPLIVIGPRCQQGSVERSERTNKPDGQ